MRQSLLQEIQDTPHGLGCTLGDVGLPEPFDKHAEVESELGRWAGDPGNLSSFEASLWPDQASLSPPFIKDVYSLLLSSVLFTIDYMKS